jgi:hypothetical protein
LISSSIEKKNGMQKMLKIWSSFSFVMTMVLRT